MRRFAVTDIHGCLRTMDALLNTIAFTRADELYLLGDYIDRGPDSKGVIDRILSLREEGYTVKCLQGNHEVMLLRMAQQPVQATFDFYPGLVETLMSYGCRHPNEIPANHLEFLSSLPYYLEVDDFFLVHAGLNFKAADPLQDTESMLWIRNWYPQIDKAWLGSRVILHGHTPNTVEDILRMYASLEQLSVMNLDSGCVFEASGMNHLTAFDMTNRRLYFQKSVEDLIR